ncbi:DEAD/DEAH box helicase [Aliivibrio fischeri]|uniref:DEAD/DEAH box helicase n=1 Tax=Aliivibrio fischeri TaxID=668 RepID=UPI0012D8CD2A|nr:DEAD/DEAH box helicase [Aliivibrio fischeri]MUK38421.1 DEAD/DEAH box helicase [Aliivibrio fischeri]
MDSIIERINNSDIFDFSDTFDIYKYVSILINSDFDLSYKLIVYILNNRYKFDSSLDSILTDLIEAVGFYPYLDKEKFKLDSTSASLRYNSNRSQNVSDRVFHDGQKEIVDIFKSKKNVIVSAPTSFGKSLLIEDVVASYKYKNIIIIQPTLALLDETRKKLRKYDHKYKLILRTSQKPDDDKGNLFLFTAERVTEYESFPEIEYLVVDEFYKLSAKRDDGRSDTLNNAFNYILNKFNPRFYLLGPNIDGISEGFKEKYNAVFYKTNYSLVQCESIDIYKEYKGCFGERGSKRLYKEKVLFELLYKIRDENSLIYCSSPRKARYLAIEYQKFLYEKGIKESSTDLPLIEWINENVTPRWSLVKCLKFAIGIHDGALQKHITSTIIEYFNEFKVKQLFCTSTIIEGVNTSAQNIIYFDKKKGKNTEIDFFDYSNIKGRAGRLMSHYVGKIYNFNETPKQTQIYIDIPFFEQNPISNEVLINIEDSEIKDKSTKQYEYIANLPYEEKALFSKNTLFIEGQSSLLSYLRKNIDSDYHLICWDSLPTYEQLSYCIGLAWDYLIKPNEAYRPMTKKRLVKITFDYAMNQNILMLAKNIFNFNKSDVRVDKSEQELIDLAICESFHILRHWFEYKIPKWLSVVNEIQKFVCLERGIRPGNYLYYSSLVENDFVQENLVILTEYGIPKSAIDKLSKYIPKSTSQDDVLVIMKTLKNDNKLAFSDYEIAKIIESF